MAEPKNTPEQNIRQKLTNEKIRLAEQLTSITTANRTEYTKIIKYLLDKSRNRMLEIVKKWAKAEISKEVQGGIAQAQKKTPAAKRKPLPQRLITELVQRKANKMFVQITDNANQTYKTVWKSINRDITRASTETSIKDLKANIATKLADKGFLTIQYSNGVNMPLDAYAEMVARSARTETFNTAAIEYAKQSTDLVECSIIFPTCDICAKFQGRVYSVSGKDKRYPSLYETALANGFELIHPNCRHQFLPYHEELDEPRERSTKQSNSNRPFADNRTERNRKSYQDWQALNAKRAEKRRDKLEKKLDDNA